MAPEITDRRSQKKIWNSLTFQSWNSWNPENHVSFKSSNEWRGHGEEKFAEELRLLGRPSAVVGLNEESFDVLESDGTRWEVKEVSSKGFRIRPGKAGISAARPLIKVVADLVEGLRRMHELVSADGPSKAYLLSLGVDVNRGLTFLETASRKIGEGSISKGMIVGGTSQNPFGLTDVLRSLSAVESHGRPVDGKAEFLFEDGQNGIFAREKICYLDYLFRLRAVGLPVPSFVGKLDMFCSGLWDPRVRPFVVSPSSFVDLWERSTTVKSTFSCVDAIVIVHERDGYAMVRVDDAHEVMAFDNVSQGRAMYRLIRRQQEERYDETMECDTGEGIKGLLPVQRNTHVGHRPPGHRSQKTSLADG